MYLNIERQLVTIILLGLLIYYISKKWTGKYYLIRNILSNIKVMIKSSDKSIGDFVKSELTKNLILGYLAAMFKSIIKIALILLFVNWLYCYFFNFSLLKTVSDYYNFVILSMPNLIKSFLNFIRDVDINYIINHELAAVVALGLVIIPMIKNKIWNNEHWFVNSYKNNNDYEVSIINLAKKSNLFRLDRIYVSNNRNGYLNEVSFNERPFKNLSKCFLIRSESDKLITLKNDEIRRTARKYNLKMYYNEYKYRKKYYSDLIIKQILRQQSDKIQRLYSTVPRFKFQLKDDDEELNDVLTVNKWSNEYKVIRLLNASIITEEEIAKFIISNNGVDINKISITMELEFKRDKNAFIQLHQTQKCSLRNITIKNK